MPRRRTTTQRDQTSLLSPPARQAGPARPYGASGPEPVPAAVGTAPAAEREHVYGPEGWTVESGVLDLLEPFAAAWRAALGPGIRAAASALPGLKDAKGDMVRFEGVGSTAAGRLRDLLPAKQLADRQNEAPSLGTLLRSVVEHPGVVELHGYVITAPRADERVTGEGVVVHGADDLLECRNDTEVWRRIRDEFGLGDALAPPDELRVRWDRVRPDEPCWRLWWD